MSLLDETKEAIAQMGQRLRHKRLQRNEAQDVFAARIGVTRPTLQKMERGDYTIQLKHWAAVLEIFDRTSDLDLLLREEEDLFTKHASKKPERKRARRSKYEPDSKTDPPSATPD